MPRTWRTPESPPESGHKVGLNGPQVARHGPRRRLAADKEATLHHPQRDRQNRKSDAACDYMSFANSVEPKVRNLRIHRFPRLDLHLRERGGAGRQYCRWVYRCIGQNTWLTNEKQLR